MAVSGSSSGGFRDELSEMRFHALGGGLREELLPKPSFKESKACAEERRGNISKFLSIGGKDVAGEDPTPEPSTERFLERPDDKTNLSMEFGPHEAAGQAAILAWQIARPELLLLERVCELVSSIDHAIREDEERAGQPSALHSAGVELIFENFEDETFPWKVVIRTDNPNSYAKVLQANRRWLGIGVDIAPATRTQFLGKCQKGEGLSGMIGGIVRQGKVELRSTCSHVLSSACESRVIEPSHDPAETRPDATLIRETPCFPAGRNIPCNVGTGEYVAGILGSREPIYFRNARGAIRRGSILSITGKVMMGGRISSFPCIHAVPWPEHNWKFWDTVYSVPGDSGAWVFDEAMSTWLGMVTAGFVGSNGTLASLAEPILTYYELVLGAKLSPHRFT